MIIFIGFHWRYIFKSEAKHTKPNWPCQKSSASSSTLMVVRVRSIFLLSQLQSRDGEGTPPLKLDLEIEWKLPCFLPKTMINFFLHELYFR
jgi:hypothetical protein